jgi:acetyl esterase/lipase
VRFWVDGQAQPVQREHIVDLTAARRSRPDPMRAWQLRVEMLGVTPREYGGVHLIDVPPRQTGSFARIELCDSQLFAKAVDAPGGGEVAPGLTVGELLIANRLRPDPAGARYEPDVGYGEPGEPARVASVYRRADPSKRVPAVVFVHGGGWSSGDRGLHYRHMHQLAGAGYVSVNIEYRRHPQVGWRDSVADVLRAIRWVRENAAWLGADPDRIAIVGGSAGAHLAALAACDPDARLAAAVLFYPPVDLPEVIGSWGAGLAAALAPYFRGELAQASPINRIGPHCPPVLTLTGDADHMIALGPVRRFHARLSEHGVPNELVVYPGEEHGFDLFGTQWDVSAAAMREFLDRALSVTG